MEHVNPYLFGIVLTGWLLLFSWGLIAAAKAIGNLLIDLFKHD